MAEPQLHAQALQWPVEKSSRAFRVLVVEPTEYKLQNHAAIFFGSLEALLSPSVRETHVYMGSSTVPVVQNFDLITFPEAFLPLSDLKAALNRVSQLNQLGCVHVGLCSSQDISSHLIGVGEIKSTIDELSTWNSVKADDLQLFGTWLESISANSRLNLGCVFSVDADGKLRICFHAKMVKASIEISAVSDHNMTEANLLSVITLLPVSKHYLSVVMQPVICADALSLSTSIPGRLPLLCLNSDEANAFKGSLPDHVDIVSVATCTPQQKGQNIDGEEFRKWHEDFCATFESIGYGRQLYRHFHATVVLANFLNVPGTYGAGSVGKAGGLSGAFYPLKPLDGEVPPFAQVMPFGKYKVDANNRWADPSQKWDPKFMARGYVAHLKPEPQKFVTAKMFEFMMTNLPRDTPHWKPGGALSNFVLYTGRFDKAGKEVTFSQGAPNVA